MSTAQRYNLAYNFVFEKLPHWKKDVLINPQGRNLDDRVMKDFTKDVVRLAESDKKIPAVKCNYVVPQVNTELQPSGVK